MRLLHLKLIRRGLDRRSEGAG